LRTLIHRARAVAVAACDAPDPAARHHPVRGGSAVGGKVRYASREPSFPASDPVGRTGRGRQRPRPAGGLRELPGVSLSRVGLQKMYRLTLTLTLLLAVFAADRSG